MHILRFRITYRIYIINIFFAKYILIVNKLNHPSKENETMLYFQMHICTLRFRQRRDALYTLRFKFGTWHEW